MPKYKSVGLYDAETKKNTTKTINIEGMTEKEIKDIFDKIKKEQKKKNLLYKMNNEGIKEEKVVSKQMQKKESVKEISVNTKNNVDLILNNDSGNTIFLLGASQRGKSTVLMYLYDKYFSGNDFVTLLFAINYQIKAYKNHKNLIICKTFNKQSEKLIKLEKYINSNCDNKYKFCNMFDDIIGQKYNTLLNDLIMTYRNSNISSLISLQYPKLLNRTQRTNIHNVLLFGFNNDEAIIDVVKFWLKGYFSKLGYKTELEQVEFYKEVTRDHGFIYVSSLHDHISFHRLII